MEDRKAALSKQTIALWVITGLVLGAQGLYFSYQWLLLGLLIYGAMIWYVLKYGGLSVPKDMTTLYLAVMVGLHGLAFLYVEEKGMLAFGTARYMGLLGFYLWLWQTDLEHLKESLLRTYIRMMAVIAAVSVSVMLTGWSDGLALVVDGRLSGSFQYANTMAVMCGTALLLLFKTDFRQSLKAGILFVLMSALLLTYSRGGIILSLAVLLIYMVIEVRDRRMWLMTPAALAAGFVLMKLIGDYETAERLVTHGSQASEWQTRLLYYKDGLTMLKDRWYGFGTNGYHYAQSYYQTGSVYSVKYIHSGLFQIALDIGLIGGVMTGLWMLHVLLKQKDWAGRCSLLLIFAHSCVDFDLQYGAVWLVILLLVTREESPVLHLGRPKITAGVLAVLIFGAGYLLTASLFYENEDYVTATNLYPGYTEAYRQMMKAAEDPDDLVAEKAGQLLRLNPYVTEGYEVLRQHSLKTGDYEGALEYSELQVHYRPIAIENHEIHSHMLLLNATYAHAHGDDERAIKYLELMLELPGRLSQLANDRDTDYNVNHKPRLTMNQALMKDYVEAGHLMDEITGP